MSSYQHEHVSDLGTDLLLRNALTRRDLAFDNCRLVEFGTFNSWTDMLLDAYTEPAASEDLQKVTISQLHRADLALFKVMAVFTRKGIKPKSNGEFPLEVALLKAMNMPQVLLHLTQRTGTAGGAKRGRAEDDMFQKDDKVKMQNKIDALQKQVTKMQQGGGGGKQGWGTGWQTAGQSGGCRRQGQWRQRR